MKNKNILHQEFFKESETLSFILKPSGHFVEANKATLKAFDIKGDIEPIQIQNIPELLNPEEVTKKLKEAISGGKMIFEIEFKRKRQKMIPYEVYAKKVSHDSENYIFCSAHTIFNSKEVENKILSAVIETEEKERSRFAKDLHDGLGPLLSTIKLYVHELNADDNDTEEQKDYIKYITELLDEAITNTRDISNNLTPQILSNYGLTKSIESFINKINATHKLEITFNYQDIPDSLHKSIELTLFRIVIELINNTIKHAYANTVELSIKTENSKLLLNYKDDGVGFDFNKALQKGSSGIGLTNIINRTRALSGDFFFNDKLDKGIDINFSLDINI